MKLNSLIKESRFDKRIIEWGIRHKMITHSEYQKCLQSLPDLSDQKESLIRPDGLSKTEEKGV